MSASIIPQKTLFTSWNVQAPYALNRGVAPLRTTINLADKIGGMLIVGVGLSGTTSLTDGVDVIVRALGGTNAPAHTATIAAFRSRITCGERAINSGTGYVATTQSFAFDGAGGTAFVAGDEMCFWGVNAVPGADGLVNPANGVEFLRVSSGTTTPMVPDRPCVYAKIDNEVICQGNCWNVWLDGDQSYEVIWDYGNDSAGGRVLCCAAIVTHDNDQIIEQVEP